MNSKKVCHWRYDDSDYEMPVWSTDCDQEFVCGEFELKELKINYCQNCGGRVVQAPSEIPGDDNAIIPDDTPSLDPPWWESR